MANQTIPRSYGGAIADNLANSAGAATPAAGVIVASMMSGTGEVLPASIAPGAVSPDKMGLVVWNASGSTLTVGQLVYISGYSAANSMPQVSLSINNVKGQEAQYVVAAAILNGASGTVRRHWLSTATLNVSGSVGDPVYLDSAAGGWTQTAPSGASTRQQVIGRVVAVSASVGQIDFNTDSAGILSTIGTVDIEAGAVTPEQLGLVIWNATGSTLTPGQLVYLSGYNVANSLPQASLASNSSVYGSCAAYVVPANIGNGASGTVRRHWLSTANLNTSGGSVGQRVYLDTPAGSWVAGNPPVYANTRSQVVGHVVVSDPALGVINFDLESNAIDSLLSLNQLQPAAIQPANIGNLVYNGTGTTLNPNELVYVSGYNVANGCQSVSRADAKTANARATWVVINPITNTSTGYVAKQSLSNATLNTNAASGVGALVYSDTSNGTIGGWIVAAPAYRVDVVGVVVVKSASVGQIYFDLTGTDGTMIGSADIEPACIGTSLMAATAVTGAILSAAGATKSLQVLVGTLATAADEEILIVAPVAGSLSLLTLTGKDALAQHDTNYQALGLTNMGQAGLGSTDMLSQTAGAKTTKITGGQALTAYGKTVFPLHATAGNLIVAKGDTLKLTVTHNGTPANTVTECYAALEFTFTT